MSTSVGRWLTAGDDSSSSSPSHFLTGFTGGAVEGAAGRSSESSVRDVVVSYVVGTRKKGVPHWSAMVVVVNRLFLVPFSELTHDHHKASPCPRRVKRTCSSNENEHSARLLQLAVPLVKTHGFTRAALARAVLDLPEPHAEPLPDGAVTALFGRGDDARRTLVRAWLEDARCRMRRDDHDRPGASAPTVRMRDVLHARMRMNEPVLEHLPEVGTSSPRYHAPLIISPRPGVCAARHVVAPPARRSDPRCRARGARRG